MRILITHPFPLDDCPTGGLVQTLAGALRGAGHEVHLLVIARPDSAANPSQVVRSVTCRSGDPAADLDFDVPCFESDPAARQTFAALSDDQIARYREVLRGTLDREVDAFDPQVIQVEYVWLLGQLVLETGVPYVARAWGPELTSCLGMPRLRGLAQQAAENAGRIIVADRAQADAVEHAFDVGSDRIAVLPPSEVAAAPFVQLYRTVLEERFGTPPAE
jgi:hypothetical protein